MKTLKYKGWIIDENGLSRNLNYREKLPFDIPQLGRMYINGTSKQQKFAKQQLLNSGVGDDKYQCRSRFIDEIQNEYNKYKKS